MSPHHRVPLVIEADLVSGAPLFTSGRGGGKVGWDNFTFQASLVTLDSLGRVTLPADPRVTDGLLPHVQATVMDAASFTAGLDIPVRYDGAFLCDVSGAAGASGFNGTSGMDGMSGTPGSCDGTNPIAGGNGGDGTDGGNGGDGGNGQPGPSVQVWVALRAGTMPLLQVKVSVPGQDQYFLVNPAGGSLRLMANGGVGGTGGAGGMGGNGGAGGVGCPDGMPGLNGRTGVPGADGLGANGGSFTVTVDPAAQPYVAALQFSNTGGQPGGVDGPAPTFTVAPVPALW